VAGFNPRPPHGGRRDVRLCWPMAVTFQSTPSARRATPPTIKPGMTEEVSIHALRTEGDLARLREEAGKRVSIHALRTEGDWRLPLRQMLSTPFQSTPSARRATGPARRDMAGVRFQSTPSARRATTC